MTTKRQLKLHLVVIIFVLVVASAALWEAVADDGFEWPLTVVIILIGWYLFKFAFIVRALLSGRVTNGGEQP